ncbi:MAG: Uncharacterized protein G01um10147_242 [Microgenomates group bacterium Gr01-1014_7]|nr:MAG: Uncharacterized protein G01um10147_242 [Microgenomates group bacterium Gr01-1014_7]
MKRKIEEYKRALILRGKGKSIKQIARILGVSVSIVSVWCRGVRLTDKQIENLKRRKIRIRHLRKLARQSHLEKVKRVQKLFQIAKAEVGPLSDREIFLTGLALYWAEGFKSLKEARLGFCNSDPAMIKFIIRWLKKGLKVKQEDFILRTEFNLSHKDREEEIKIYWSKITGVPLTQFEKPFYHQSNWLREYPSRDNYFGVLRIRVRKSSELLNKMRGWISGLAVI